MTRVLLIAAIAIFACGFALAPTPKEIEAQERAARKWSQTVQSRYDFAALTSFLKKTVAEKKSWQDIDLTKPKIGDKWTMDRWGTALDMISGDWSFSTSDPKGDKFTLSFTYDKGDRQLILKCIRKTKDSFVLLEITSEEAVVMLI